MAFRSKTRWLWALVVFAAFIPRATADATLLLEEPYGHFGAFTATGHAAVYLSRVCTDTYLSLRRCEAGETGVVIGRYNKVAGKDWIAVPLVPYLYAVEDPEDVPLYANAKIVAFLRNAYRKNHLEEIIPDEANGEPPNGNWTQLVGSAYDRTIYGFTIETTPQQDDAFIREYNARSNTPHFNLLAHNCADFSRAVINFYYPKTLHRNLIADVGITTPKEIAKLLVKFSDRHPDLESSSFVIPQVPGSMPRSTKVHGVVESVLKSKKYLIPVALLHPFVTGGLAVAYVSDGRFDPAKHAMVFESGREPEPPLASAERRSYESQVRQILARVGARQEAKSWARLEKAGEPDFDENGRPTLRVRIGEQIVDVGISRDNIATAPPDVASDLLAARLQMELRRGAEPVSASDVDDDWQLLRLAASATSSLE
jgi:hypothetical protein